MAEGRSASIGSTTPPHPAGDDGRQQLGELVPLLYQELRRLAHRQLGRRPHGGTLETGELVHEAYLKVVAHAPDSAVPSQPHFMALASVAMRHVLVDRAKARGRINSSRCWTYCSTPRPTDAQR